MSGAVIVIEIAAPSVSTEALAVLVSSCTRAARDAECVLAKNASDERPDAVAIVSAQAEDKMRVEVGVRQGDRDSWRTKDFAFLPADEAIDRWRAVGFAIGTLAESDPVPPATATAAAPATSPAPPANNTSKVVARVAEAPRAPPKPAPKQPPSTPLFVGAAALFGPGLDRGPWRLGAALYGDVVLGRGPIFFRVGGSAATSDLSGTAARWYDVSLGAGVRLIGALESSGLELSARMLVEDFDVSVSASDGRSAERERWIFGFESELGGRVQVVPDLFLTAGAVATGLSAATDVRAFGLSVGTASSFRYAGLFGLRVRLR
ncbi:MAG: hypothetical protein ABI488_14340 [Polyangiaceae bacterium]